MSNATSWAALDRAVTVMRQATELESIIKDDVDAIQSAASRVAEEAAAAVLSRRVSGAGLATGGGELSSDQTITVPKASQAEAEDGAADDKAMTPLRVKQAIAKLRGFVSIKDAPFLAAGNGLTDDRAAIQAAIDYVYSQGGGVVFIPPGTYAIKSAPQNNGIGLKNGVHIVGAGRGATLVRLGDAVNGHVFNGTFLVNASVRSMTIDGNELTQTVDVHGIRLGSGSSDVTLTDLHIRNCRRYGIGCQQGGHSRTLIENVFIENTGADGIDFKDYTGIPVTGIRINNIVAKNIGKYVTNCVGLDMRGQFNVSNIFVFLEQAECSGIRFRGEGELSNLTNFYVAGNGLSGQAGLNVNAHDVHVEAGNIDGCSFGVLVNSPIVRPILKSVTASACGVGFQVNSEVGYAIFDECSALNCTTLGYRVDGDNVTINGGYVVQTAGNGIRFTSNATGGRVFGVDFRQCSVLQVWDQTSDGVKSIMCPGFAGPAITGSRGGNAAVASLLTKLATLGLITDSTTA